MENAPITKLYVVDIYNQKCSERIIINKNTLASKWIKDLDLVKCNGNISLTSEEFLNLRTYLKGQK